MVTVSLTRTELDRCEHRAARAVARRAHSCRAAYSCTPLGWRGAFGGRGTNGLRSFIEAWLHARCIALGHDQFHITQADEPRIREAWSNVGTRGVRTESGPPSDPTQ